MAHGAGKTTNPFSIEIFLSGVTVVLTLLGICSCNESVEKWGKGCDAIVANERSESWDKFIDAATAVKNRATKLRELTQSSVNEIVKRSSDNQLTRQCSDPIPSNPDHDFAEKWKNYLATFEYTFPELICALSVQDVVSDKDAGLKDGGSRLEIDAVACLGSCFSTDMERECPVEQTIRCVPADFFQITESDNQTLLCQQNNDDDLWQPVDCDGICSWHCAGPEDSYGYCPTQCHGTCEGNCTACVDHENVPVPCETINIETVTNCAGQCDGGCPDECQGNILQGGKCEGVCGGVCIGGDCEVCSETADAGVKCLTGLAPSVANCSGSCSGRCLGRCITMEEGECNSGTCKGICETPPVSNRCSLGTVAHCSGQYGEAVPCTEICIGHPLAPASVRYEQRDAIDAQLETSVRCESMGGDFSWTMDEDLERMSSEWWERTKILLQNIHKYAEEAGRLREVARRLLNDGYVKVFEFTLEVEWAGDECDSYSASRALQADLPESYRFIKDALVELNEVERITQYFLAPKKEQ